MNTRAVGQMTEMYENDVKRLNQRVAQLEAELAAAKGDAERYRLVVKNKQEVRRLIDTFCRGYD
jgi:3-phenylpropionate/cinnamic acid dioxygenase small subunit